MTDIHDMSESIHDMKLLISGFYIVVAGAIFWAGWAATDKRQRLAAFSMTAIFVLCDLSGYLGPAIGAPHMLILAGHFMIPIACLVFIFTNQHSKLFSP